MKTRPVSVLGCPKVWAGVVHPAHMWFSNKAGQRVQCYGVDKNGDDRAVHGR